MQVLLIVLMCFLAYKYISNAIHSFMQLFVNVLLLFLFKFSFNLPISVSIIFVFCLRSILMYLSKEVHLSVENCSYKRGDLEFPKLRKTIRILFEINYISFIINCYLISSSMMLDQTFINALLYVINMCVILFISNLAKKVIEYFTCKYCENTLLY